MQPMSNVRRMKKRSVFTLMFVATSGAAFLLWYIQSSTPEARNKYQAGSVTIQNPCNTFVSEFAPTTTPSLRATSGGPELVISFTPAKDPEADLVISAVASGTRQLLVAPDRYQFEALRVEKGHLFLSVQSETHAKEVLRRLCFQEKEMLTKERLS